MSDEKDLTSQSSSDLPYHNAETEQIAKDRAAELVAVQEVPAVEAENDGEAEK